MLEARDLRLLDVVAEEGSLTRAAARLNATQPALSRHLKEVEGRIRLTLFERTGRRMVLTPAGERLRAQGAGRPRCPGARRGGGAGAGRGRKTVLRMSTGCYTTYYWLPRVLQRLAERHPTVEMRIVFELTRHPVPGLLDGRLDLALVANTPSNRRMLVRPVFQDELVAVVSPHHPWATRRSVSPRDFADQRVFIVPPPEESDVLNHFLRPAKVSPREVSVVSLTEAVIAMVEAGLGVGAVPRWTVVPAIKSGQLVSVRLGRGLHRNWGVATRRTSGRSDVVDEFVDLVRGLGT
jgi:LysR family transcriptional regulator for metE and metH